MLSFSIVLFSLVFFYSRLIGCLLIYHSRCEFRADWKLQLQKGFCWITSVIFFCSLQCIRCISVEGVAFFLALVNLNQNIGYQLVLLPYQYSDYFQTWFKASISKLKKVQDLTRNWENADNSMDLKKRFLINANNF